MDALETLKHHPTLTLVTVYGRSGRREFERYDSALLAVERWYVTLDNPESRRGPVEWRGDIEGRFLTRWNLGKPTARPDVRILVGVE